tara:strand:+ start:1191 stop:1439 length:249 start_codon:yes stop_codon:yes gene_type:complete
MSYKIIYDMKTGKQIFLDDEVVVIDAGELKDHRVSTTDIPRFYADAFGFRVDKIIVHDARGEYVGYDELDPFSEIKEREVAS